MVFLNRSTLALALLLLMRCKPDLGARESQIAGPRLLAMRATPAEGAQGDAIVYDALEVDPSGEVTTPMDYAYCTLRKSLDNPDTVSFDCLAASGTGIVEIGAGSSATGTVPSDACRNFGPDVPFAQPGQPQGRPVDPDSTGGYYQPLRLLFGNEIDIGQSRIACGVANAPLEAAAKFRAQYHMNTNPLVLDVTANGASLTQDASAPTALPAGSNVTLTTSWATCPASDVCGDGICGPDESVTACAQDCTTPVGCSGAERYLHYDTVGQQLTALRETMSVAWFVTGGSMASDGTGRLGTDLATTTDDVLTLPQAGPVHGWVVLRDDRGGVGWRRFEIVAQ